MDDYKLTLKKEKKEREKSSSYTDGNRVGSETSLNRKHLRIRPHNQKFNLNWELQLPIAIASDFFFLFF